MTFLRWIYQLFRFQIGLKLVSIIIAITLWVVVFGSRTIEITKEVPFEVIMNEDQILVDPVPEKITFRLAGPKAFLRTLVNRLEDPIRANIKSIKTGVYTHRIYSDSLKMPMGVKVQSITPNVVQINVEELKRKWVPVKLLTSGEVAPNYRVTRMEILPNQVKVKGLKNRVLSLPDFVTLPVDLTGYKETAIVPLAFDFKGAGVEPDSPIPELHLEVQWKGQSQAYRILHVPVKVQSTLKATANVEEVTVYVRTDYNDPVKVDGDQVKAEVDVRDYPAGEYHKWIRIQLPEKIHWVKAYPAQCKVSILPR